MNFVLSAGGQETVALLPDPARTRHATNRRGSSLLRPNAPRAATRRAVVESTRSGINSCLTNSAPKIQVQTLAAGPSILRRAVARKGGRGSLHLQRKRPPLCCSLPVYWLPKRYRNRRATLRGCSFVSS